MKGSVKSSSPYRRMPIIRIAPVCNGKIYVVPRSDSDKGLPLMDLPIEECVDHISPKSNKPARQIKEKYRMHIRTDAEPRFSVQYKLHPDAEETVYLYILPLSKEKDIHFKQGRFVTAEEISTDPKKCSERLWNEKELLGMAAELWNSFYTCEYN